MRRKAMIILGLCMMAIGTGCFMEPKGIVMGGVSGIAIILRKTLHIPLWLTNAALNLPLLLMAFKKLGKHFFISTLLSSLGLSLFLGISEFIPHFSGDIFLATVYGGTLNGIGMGLIFRENTTTGGSDLLATLLKDRYPQLTTAQIMLVLDVCVIGLSVFSLGTANAMYSIICVYIVTKVIDLILAGSGFAKAVYIITSKPSELGKAVTAELRRGATLLDAQGVYTNKPKAMLLVVVSKKQIPALKQITEAKDPDAFVIITDVREIKGSFR